jgi:hypothetical protein
VSPLGAHFSSPSQLYSEKVCRRLVYHDARDTTGRSQAVPGEVPKISSFFGFFGMKLVEEISKKSISWLRPPFYAVSHTYLLAYCTPLHNIRYSIEDRETINLYNKPPENRFDEL